jgi:fatty-acyl-CoA synthase
MRAREAGFGASRDWVGHNAGQDPDAPALVGLDTGETRSWAELEDRVARLAAALRKLPGVDEGARVALICENDVRVFELQFACIRAGLIMVPLNWRLAVPEIQYQVRETTPVVLINDKHWMQVADQLTWERSDSSQGPAHRIMWGESAAGALDYEELFASDELMPPRMLDSSTPTHLLFTSGTTGTPKGALSTNSTMMWQALNVAKLTDVASSGARALVQQPLFHAGGLHTLANPALYFGNCVVTVRRFDATQCLELMTHPDTGITHMTGVQTMFDRMSDLPEFADADLSGMRHVHLAGNTPAPEFFERWAAKGLVIQQFYGGTEMGPAVSGLSRARAASMTKHGSCGLPVMHSEVRIADPVSGLGLGPGEVGEILVKGPSVTPGYWNKENQRAQFFTKDGFFRTGDAGRVDTEGFLYIVGRFKDMYKSGGENVYAAEVERVLSEMPGVMDVAILGVPDAQWVEVGLAVVTLHPGAEIELTDIIGFCEGRLARYKHPKHLAIVGELPRNATGKVIKATLRETFIKGTGSGIPRSGS